MDGILIVCFGDIPLSAQKSVIFPEALQMLSASPFTEKLITFPECSREVSSSRKRDDCL